MGRINEAKLTVAAAVVVAILLVLAGVLIVRLIVKPHMPLLYESLQRIGAP